MMIFSSIFFLVAGLGIMNTMLMATFERIQEFGVLKALGTSAWRIILNVALETFFLVLVATLVGGVLGVLGSYYLEVVGLDTSRWGDTSFAGIAFDPLWRAALSRSAVVFPIGVMWCVSLLASIYPAILSARLNPIEAMRHI